MPEINGQVVGPIGYGLMGFTWRPDPCPQEQAFEAMQAAVEAGLNLWNAGEFYGPPSYNSLVLLERYFAAYPADADKVVLCVKGGVDVERLVPDGSAEGVRRSMDNCLAQLGGRKKLDLFECARRDQKVSMAETFGVLQREYIDTGKLGGISLSEVSAATIHEAVKHAKIAAVEVELSLWSPDVLTNGVADACAQHGIPLVAYSPTCRGVLAGAFTSPDDLPDGDFRKHYPRFEAENMRHNQGMVAQVAELARRKGCTPAQLSINWVRCLQTRPGMPVIIPIPGSVTVERVRENAVVVDLSEDDMREIDEMRARFDVKGARYPAGAPIET